MVIDVMQFLEHGIIPEETDEVTDEDFSCSTSAIRIFCVIQIKVAYGYT